MAWIIADSFDFYGSVSTTFTADAATHWDTTSASLAALATASTRFTAGQGCVISSGAGAGQLVKASGSNDAGHHLVFAYHANAAAANVNGFTLTFMDGATAQCSVVFNPSTGSIILASGLGSGTVLATYAAGLSNSIWYGIEIEVVINNTTGSFKVRLNGNTSDDFSATGLNTRGGTANNYANKISIGCTANPLTTPRIDDFLWFSTSGAAPNTWVGDIRAQQLMPATDGTVGLTSSLGTLTQNTGSPQSGNSVSANFVSCSPQQALTYGGSLTGINVTFNATFTGHYRLGVYDGTSGTPGSLLGQTAEQTNAAVGTLTVALTSPITVASGAKIFTAILTDASASVSNQNGVGSVYRLGQTYASGLPSSMSSSSLVSNINIYGSVVVVTSNSVNVQQATEDGDTSFVYGSTASVGDLYNLGSLGVTPSSIVAVQTRMCARKSDTGTRQARAQIKSGATTSNGSTLTLGTNYSYAGAKVDTVDPNTSSAWTAAAVNSLQIGVAVVA